MKNISVIVIALMLQLSKTGCTSPPITANPPNYDLGKPVIYNMPAALEEISGIAFNGGRADTLFAEQDEEGKLFYFRPGEAAFQQLKFGKRGDYEDLAIANGNVFMLRSDGVLFSFPLSAVKDREVRATEQADLLPEGEYESLYADPVGGNLYVLCKNCSEEKKTGGTPGFILAMDNQGKLSVKDRFSLDDRAIAALAGKEKLKWRPSALAAHPFRSEWYIVSSVNKLLLVTDKQWKPLQVYALPPALFSQPEGIAFDKDGNLYISNEKGSAGQGTVLRFAYHKNKK